MSAVLAEQAVHPVRALREARGLTLQDAAQELGTSKGNLSRIETGIHGASDALKRRIAAWSAGKITANDMIGFVPGPLKKRRLAKPTRARRASTSPTFG